MITFMGWYSKVVYSFIYHFVCSPSALITTILLVYAETAYLASISWPSPFNMKARLAIPVTSISLYSKILDLRLYFL